MIAKFPIQTLKIFLLSNNDPHRLLTFGYLCFDVGRLPPPPGYPRGGTLVTKRSNINCKAKRANAP